MGKTVNNEEKCKESFTDTKDYRKNICRECYNLNSKKVMNERATTVEGYLQSQVINIKNHHYRSRFDLDVTLEQLVDIYNQQNGKCALSGIEMKIGYDRKSPYTMSIDRINSEVGYTKDNVHLIVSALNLFKSNFTLDDLHFIAKRYVENNQI